MILTGNEKTKQLTDEQVQRLAGNLLQSMEEFRGAITDFNPTPFQRAYLKNQLWLALEVMAELESEVNG